MVYWYILFTKTGSELKVDKLLKKGLDSNNFYPFIPTLETLFKSSGLIKKEIKVMFPGYVFIESELSSLEFIQETRKIINFSNDIIRILKYGDTGDINVRDHERSTLLNLCNDDFCIETSKGIIIGDKIYIKEGPLVGNECIIKKINRHKKTATIELVFMGDIRQFNISLEIVEKIPSSGTDIA